MIQKRKWWENDLIQALMVLAAIAGLLAFLQNVVIITVWWTIIVVAVFLIILFVGFKIFRGKDKETLIFIPDEMQSFWHHAPQPDGRKLTQILLNGFVTNISNRELFLDDIHLITPRAKKTRQRFIFTVHENAVDSKEKPIFPGEHTEFNGSFFIDEFLGKVCKPMAIVVSITDNLGKRHKVKFHSLWRTGER